MSGGLHDYNGFISCSHGAPRAVLACFFCSLSFEEIAASEATTSSQTISLTPFHPQSSIPPSPEHSILDSMVKFRGIEVCIISQFDICKLPEFRYRKIHHPADPFQVPGSDGHDRERGTSSPCPNASCYVPVYPGSQIWFEYTVDGPHPPGAAYFFKLLLNGKPVTAWDCTAKHGFHGKMMYNLVPEGVDPMTGERRVRRQALKFGVGMGEGAGGGLHEDLIQINVHRVEHRKRTRDLQHGGGFVDTNSNHADGLRLTDSGILEPGFRPRRYQYQLLDPVDMPYAIFQFHCRGYEYLKDHGIVRPQDCPSRCSSISSTISQVPTQHSTRSHVKDARQGIDSADILSASSSPQATATFSSGTLRGDQAQGPASSTLRVISKSAHVPPSDSDDSLSVRPKDSIEDLPSSVPRSPNSPRRAEKRAREGRRQGVLGPPPSPTKSPRFAGERLKKKLTINLGGADFDVERKIRPLSPFTSSGMLRKACILPHTAPAAVTEFGPTVEDEVREEMNRVRSDLEPKAVYRTTSAERGGFRLMGFLGRRINKDKA